MGCLRIVREEHPTVGRIVVWPTSDEPVCVECQRGYAHPNHDENRIGGHFFNERKWRDGHDEEGSTEEATGGCPAL